MPELQAPLSFKKQMSPFFQKILVILYVLSGENLNFCNYMLINGL